MIKSIALKNILSHVNTKIKFVPGINVIIGENNFGKSVLFHSYKWLRYSSPRGDGIRRTDTDRSLVKVVTTGGTVIKEKKGTKSRYVVNKKGYNGDSLPNQALDVLNLCDASFQPQKEQWFLLNDSPGQVAKRLNEVSNLSIISRCISYIKSNISKASEKSSVLEEDIKQYDDELSNLPEVERARKMLATLKDSQETIDDYESRQLKVQNLLEKRTTISSSVAELPDVSALPAIDALLDLSAEIKRHQSSLDSVKKLLLVRKAAEVLKSVDTAVIRAKLNDLESGIKKSKKVRKLLKKRSIVQTEYKESISEESELRKEVKELKEKLDFCDKCGQVIL